MILQTNKSELNVKAVTTDFDHKEAEICKKINYDNRNTGNDILLSEMLTNDYLLNKETQSNSGILSEWCLCPPDE